MIRLKFSTGEETSRDQSIEIKNGEKVLDAVLRATETIPLPKGQTHQDLFSVVVNGYIIEPKLWAITPLETSTNVVIYPRLQDSATAQSAFRTALIIGIGLASAPLAGVLGFAAGGTFGASLAYYGVATAISVVGAMAVNALFPAPDFNQTSFGTGSSVESSQMYSLTGQSNSVKRYGTVPKVYGNHRIYPAVAANPYTEIETDPLTGELVQYLYAVYDLGLGPMEVEDIFIGDTNIRQFSDQEVRLVDFNKPAIDEGPWDETLETDLAYYKGDVSSEQIGAAIDFNEVDGGDVSGYQVIRATPVNTDGANQSITLTFVNPNGLYAYSANNTISPRTIELDIRFRSLTNGVRYAWNDIGAVSDFSSAGGDQAFNDINIEIIAFTDAVISDGYLTLVSDPNPAVQQDYISPFEASNSGIYNALGGAATSKTFQYGYAKGTSSIFVKQPPPPSPPLFTPIQIPSIGQTLKYKGKILGNLRSRIPVPGYPNHFEYVLQDPLEESLSVYVRKEVQWNYGGSPFFRNVDTNPNQKLFYSSIPLGRARITRQDTGPVYSTFKFTPLIPDQYEIIVKRVQSFSTNTAIIEDRLLWTSLSTRFDRAPILTTKRHTFLEVRIRATNQLNGSIQNLNAVVTSVLDTWNGTTWVKAPTQNPAWIFVDLITGEINKRALAKTRLDIDSIYEWAQFCDAIPTAPPSQNFSYPRFMANFVLDYATTLQEAVNQVANSAQASLNIVDGKYGVLIDKLKTTPVQIFTPRNSSGFNSSRVYTVKPNALKIKYIDPGSNWEPQEAIVYDEGFNSLNAETFEELTSIGCSNWEQAWRYGRYILFQNKLRQENISIKVDFEYLVCSRGDYVQITQDVMKVGGTPARVIAVSGNQITIDDGIDTGIDAYGYVFRKNTGEIYTSTLTVNSSDTFTVDGDIPAVGNLIVIGVVGEITFDCIVKSIRPNDDLTATLVLVEKADEIYTAESTDSFPVYLPQINVTTDSDFAPPGPVVDLVVADNFWECADSGYRYYVELDWDAPAGSAYEAFEVYADSGRGFNLAAVTRESIYKYIVDPLRLDLEHTFKVLAVSATGKKIDLGSAVGVTATPVTKRTPPSDVEFLATDITNEVLQLSWTQIADCDCREYLIRYSPALDATWQTSIPLLRVDRNTTLTSTQARTGTYLIKAVDFNFNESANVALAITTIPNLFGLNVITEVTDFPDLNGELDQTVNLGGTLLLQPSVTGPNPEDTEYFSEGYYYYQDLLDLGDIFTVRIQSLIQAEGYTADDVMANWATLSAVSLLANSRTSEWDVEAQYRATESLNLIEDWVTLDSIDPIGGGSDDVFTPWRKFTIGDVTGRIIQFRLKLISNKLSVSPRVFDGTIRADMPDRVDTFNNILAPDTGYTVTYSPEFKGPSPSPNVQISIDDAESGDYWVFTSKTLLGFTIQFYDRNDVAVSRTFDASVRGFGRRSNSII